MSGEIGRGDRGNKLKWARIASALGAVALSTGCSVEVRINQNPFREGDLGLRPASAVQDSGQCLAPGQTYVDAEPVSPVESSAVARFLGDILPEDVREGEYTSSYVGDFPAVNGGKSVKIMADFENGPSSKDEGVNDYKYVQDVYVDLGIKDPGEGAEQTLSLHNGNAGKEDCRPVWVTSFEQDGKEVDPEYLNVAQLNKFSAEAVQSIRQYRG